MARIALLHNHTSGTRIHFAKKNMDTIFLAKGEHVGLFIRSREHIEKLEAAAYFWKRYPASICSCSRNAFSARRNRPLRTNQYTEMTAHTFLSVQDRFSTFVQSNRLMPAIGTGNLAPSAANALFTIEFWEDYRAPFQYVGCFADRIQCKPCGLFHA